MIARVVMSSVAFAVFFLVLSFVTQQEFWYGMAVSAFVGGLTTALIIWAIG